VSNGLRAILLVLAIPGAILAADPLFESAWNKLERIESGQAKRGSVIVFTPAEITAWARGRVPQLLEGIREPHVQLGMGAATGSARVDFLKMRQGEGLGTNPVIAKLIEGERPLKVSVRLDSSDGHATAYLTGVELSGITVPRPVLDFLVKDFFLPLFPDARINQPFELRDNIDRIDIRPDGVRVAIKR